jgi:genome maintenance exonuclease 1
MSKFKQGLAPLPDLETIEFNNKRYYITPIGNIYPSVTTFLSSLHNQKLEEWKQRVGETVAEEISLKARTRGTRYHKLIESYLISGNRQKILSENMPNMKQVFLDIEKDLSRINNIHFIEQALYSDKLRLAGRADLISEFDGVLSIVDFKTSNREKTEADIESYFIQTAIYAQMYEELTYFNIKQLVIFMICDDLNHPLIFKMSIDRINYKAIRDRVKNFHKGIK